MKKTVCLLLALLLAVLSACDSATAVPAVPAQETASDPSSPEAIVISGLVYDATKGEGAPLSASRVRFQVEREGELWLQGETKVGSDGRFGIGVYLDEEDFLTLEGMAAGYVSSRVHLDLSQLRAGESLLLGLEPPAEVALRIAGWDWRPPQLDPAVEEWPEIDTAGLLSIYLKNDGPLPLEIDQLMLNGERVADLVNARRVMWSRLQPNPIPAGGMASWELELAETPDVVNPSIYPANAHEAEATLALRPSPLLLSYVTWSHDQERLFVFVHNQSDQDLVQLDSVWCNGAQVPSEILQRDLGPGETALIVADPGLGPDTLDTVYCQVAAHIYQGEEVSAWGAVSLSQPTFPIGTWPEAEDLDPATLDTLMEHGLDTLVLDLPPSPGDPLWQRLEATEHFRILARPRFPANQAELALFAEEPSVLAWFLVDEPAYHLGRLLFGAFETARDPGDTSEGSWRLGQAFVEAEQAYRRPGGPPTYITLSSYELMPKYAPVSDLAGVVHYAIDAPGANWNGSHALEEVFTYTVGLRRQVAPALIWPWAQALCSTSWYENTSACWNRLPTPAEVRAQLYLQLAAGAKGVLWYAYRPEFLPAGQAQWAEVARQNRLLGAVKDLFLFGEVADTVVVDAPSVLARAIVSEHAVAVPLVNLDYAWERQVWPEGEDPPLPSQPYAFQERGPISLTLLLPEWIRPAAVLSVSPEGVANLGWTQDARALHTALTELLDVGLIVVVDDVALAEELAAQLSAN